jgi:hypothetical protein
MHISHREVEMEDGKEERQERIDGIIDDVRKNQVDTSEYATILKGDFQFLVKEARENVGRLRFRGMIAGVSNKPSDGGTMEIKVKAPLTPRLAAASVTWLHGGTVLVLIDPEDGQIGLPGADSGLTEAPAEEGEGPELGFEGEQGDIEGGLGIDEELDEDGNPVEMTEEFDKDGNPVREN